MVTKIWLVYATEEPQSESYKHDWSCKVDGTRIIEVMNHDITGSNNFSIIKITRDTIEDCLDEFYGQITDGIWENEIHRPVYIEIQ